jgi:acetolactate synthase-1/2/3 large subunit
MHVGRAVVDWLAANGVEVVFGIPGKQTLPLNEAIDGREDVRFVVARHETAVTHQAWGYAETSDDLAATLVVPGPGDMNAMNGLKNAYNDCTPMLHLSVETDPEIRGGDGIHETPPDTYDNVVKENVLVETAESTLVELQRAVGIARSPPKGPVRVGIPKGFLADDVPLADPGRYEPASRHPPSDEELAAAVDLLAGSEAPVVLAGGGVRASGATDALVAVAERLEAPVVTTYKGKGTFPEDHRLFAGVLSGSASPELLDCIADSDAALGVGTDLDAVATRSWSVEVPDRLVHVTLDPSDVGTGYAPSVGIVADARETLLGLADRLDPGDRDPDDRAVAVRAGTDERLAPLRDREPFTSVGALSVLADVVPDDAVVAADAGGFRVWSLNAFPANGPRSYVTPGSWATMGTGLPSGIGARLASEEDVVVLTGDGGLLMCLHELHTAVAEELPLVVVVLDNSDYAIISEEAERAYGLDEGYGWGGAPIDFVRVAEGLGMAATRAETPEAVRTAVSEALGADRPTLVQVPTDPEEPQASEWMRE